MRSLNSGGTIRISNDPGAKVASPHEDDWQRVRLFSELHRDLARDVLHCQSMTSVGTTYAYVDHLDASRPFVGGFGEQ